MEIKTWVRGGVIQTCCRGLLCRSPNKNDLFCLLSWPGITKQFWRQQQTNKQTNKRHLCDNLCNIHSSHVLIHLWAITWRTNVQVPSSLCIQTKTNNPFLFLKVSCHLMFIYVYADHVINWNIIFKSKFWMIRSSILKKYFK